MLHKSISIKAIAAAVLLSCSMAAGARTLYLRTTSDSDKAVELGQIESITFGDQTVTILLTDNSKVECSTANFKSISSTTGSTSSVANIDVANDEQWQVYDLKGNNLGSATSIAGEGVALSSRLAPGVYIVKSNSKTLKLIVR